MGILNPMGSRFHPILILVLALPNVCLSEDTSPPKQKRGQWVLSNGIGDSWTRSTTVTVSNAGSNTRLQYSNVKWDSEGGERPPIYNFRAMYWSSPEARLGYGLEFVHNKMVANKNQVTNVTGTLNGQAYNQVEPIGNTLQQFAITNGLNLFHGIVQLRKPLDESGRSHVYGGVGLGFALPHPVTRFLNGSGHGNYQNGGFSWHGFGGYEYRIGPVWAVYAEAKYIDYPLDIDMGDGTRGSARIRSTMLLIGINYRL